MAKQYDLMNGCVDPGVLIFSLAGPGDATIRISPPLVISEKALTESLDPFEEVFAHSVLLPADAVQAPVSV